MRQQQVSITYLFQFIRSGGVYIIEDLNTSWNNAAKYQEPPADSGLTTAEQIIKWANATLHRKHIPELPGLVSIDCGAEMCAFFKRSHPF